jgi:hypothetical protein
MKKYSREFKKKRVKKEKKTFATLLPLLLSLEINVEKKKERSISPPSHPCISRIAILHPESYINKDRQTNNPQESS